MSRNAEVPTSEAFISETLGGIGRKYWTLKPARGRLGHRMRSVEDCDEVQFERFSFRVRFPMPSEFAQHIDPPTTQKKPPASVTTPFPERLLDSEEAASIMNVHPSCSVWTCSGRSMAARRRAAIRRSSARAGSPSVCTAIATRSCQHRLPSQ